MPDAISMKVPHNLVQLFNTLRPRQNGRHFADNIFKCNFFNENVWTLIKISMNYFPKGPIINNILTLAQIMAWCRSGDKPLSEPMMVSLLTNICINICISLHIYIYPYVCFLFMYVYMQIHLCMHIYIYDIYWDLLRIHKPRVFLLL